MENQSKLTSAKQVITFLAETFPHCFSIHGEARPLKIGIFQDLVARVSAHEAISKTRLRGALRFYTASWRYLGCIKPGAVRVDLDGNACGEMEAQHVEFARQKLAEAKARVREKREKAAQEEKAKRALKARAPEDKVGQEKPSGEKQSASAAGENAKDALKDEVKAEKAEAKRTVKAESDRKDDTSAAVRQAAPVLKAPAKSVDKKVSAPAVEISRLMAGQQVRVKLGNSEMPACVQEVAKEGVRVRLASGMSMIVRAEHLVL